MAPEIILNINHLSKKFANNTVLKSINLSVKVGEIYALIGPNGSGKTTLIRNLVGLYRPDEGSITLGGFDIQKQPFQAKSVFGYVPDNPINYPNLSGIEFLRLTARLRSLSRVETEKKIAELTQVFPLRDIFPHRLENYSRGNLQKITFLAALLAKPKLLIIDEPIVGLDPTSIQIFGKTLTQFAHSGGAVFFSSHTLPFTEHYATKVGILNKGQLVHETTNFKNLESIYTKYT